MNFLSLKISIRQLGKEFIHSVDREQVHVWSHGFRGNYPHEILKDVLDIICTIYLDRIIEETPNSIYFQFLEVSRLKLNGNVSHS